MGEKERGMERKKVKEGEIDVGQAPPRIITGCLPTASIYTGLISLFLSIDGNGGPLVCKVMCVCVGFLGLPWEALICIRMVQKNVVVGIYRRIVGSMEETDRWGSCTCNYACDKKICNKRDIYVRNVRRRRRVSQSVKRNILRGWKFLFNLFRGN